MIYTLTTNPAVDMNISCAKPIEYSKINRTFNAKYTANGKGINVSNTLKHFGIDSKILGFFGGFTGDFIVKDIQKKGFEVKPVMVKENTRVNVFLNDSKGEFNFVNEGSYVSFQSQDEMLKIISGSNDMDILSISGSLAKGIDDNFYDSLLKICNSKNIKIVLDISSKKLKSLLNYKPYLIKPNDEEVEDIFAWSLNSQKAIIDALKNLHNLGAQNVLLTCGDKGMYFYDGRQVFYACMEPVKIVSSACAGDASMAAFMSVFINNEQKIIKALKLACATGANVVESKGLGDFNKVSDYENKVEVVQLKP